MNKDLGQYEEFALMVRAIVGERSLRAVNVRTGVGHTTILNMTNGLRPKATTIRLFAEGMGVDPNPLLEAAGYPPLPTRQVSPSISVNGESEGGEIERVSDSQEPEAESRLKWMAAYDHLPFKIRESMLAQAEAILEEQYQQRGDIVGKRQK
jgi:hypothetical protein